MLQALNLNRLLFELGWLVSNWALHTYTRGYRKSTLGVIEQTKINKIVLFLLLAVFPVFYIKNCKFNKLYSSKTMKMPQSYNVIFFQYFITHPILLEWNFNKKHSLVFFALLFKYFCSSEYFKIKNSTLYSIAVSLRCINSIIHPSIHPIRSSSRIVFV